MRFLSTPGLRRPGVGESVSKAAIIQKPAHEGRRKWLWEGIGGSTTETYTVNATPREGPSLWQLGLLWAP